MPLTQGSRPITFRRNSIWRRRPPSPVLWMSARPATCAGDRLVQVAWMPTQRVPDDSRAASRTADAGDEEHGRSDRQDHTDWVSDVNRDGVVNPRRHHHDDRAGDKARHAVSKGSEL